MEKGEEAVQEGAAPEPGAPDLAAELEKAKAESKDNWERFLRARADLENYQRRAEREMERGIRLGKRGLFLRLLDVLDNLERALGSVDGAGGTLSAGVEMIRRQLGEVLGAEGIVAIKALGEPFDPAWHEVMQVEDDPEAEGETVTAEFQKGYAWGEEALRPARVKVTRPAG